MSTVFKIFISVAVIAFIAGCGGREVTRTNPDTVTDLSGYWNETDAQMVADSMISQCLGGRWLTDFSTASRGGERPDEAKPVIVVGGIYNESSEHINTDIFMNSIEQAFLNSGEIQIAAGGASRGEVRSEREDQTIFASPETAAEFGHEIGADFVMTGSVGSIVDEEGEELLDVFDLKRYAEELPKNLPYGTQRKLEIARALSSHPKLLLLDEPAAGLNSADAKDLIRLIRWIHETFDVTIWMIEHHMDVMMELCTQIKVIDFGETIAEGSAEHVRNHPAVMTAYLGDDNI